MKRFSAQMILWLGLAGLSATAQGIEEREMTTAKGTFEVKVTPQEDAVAPAGRMLLEKVYQGDAVGTGTGQMISKQTDGGTAVYYAIEEFSGSVKGRTGGFTLVHRGHMNSESQSLEVLILEGSGSGELQGISGSMLIEQDEGGHRYELSFEL
jgi:hypothetical protein